MSLTRINNTTIPEDLPLTAKEKAILEKYKYSRVERCLIEQSDNYMLKNQRTSGITLGELNYKKLFRACLANDSSMLGDLHRLKISEPSLVLKSGTNLNKIIQYLHKNGK